jgi:hypothetical protein
MVLWVTGDYFVPATPLLDATHILKVSRNGTAEARTTNAESMDVGEALR